MAVVVISARRPIVQNRHNKIERTMQRLASPDVECFVDKEKQLARSADRMIYLQAKDNRPQFFISKGQI
jgi:hypothetical protein